MLKTLILLFFPVLIQAQQGVIYPSSLTKTYTTKSQLDSLAGIVTTSVNSLSSTVAGKASAAELATKTSFSQVSDSVYSKAETVMVLSYLKTMPVAHNKVVMLVGKTSVGDNLGGFYRFDTTATGADEMTYLNTINSSLTTTGRWVRVFQKARTVTGGGILVNNGGVKNYFATMSTNSSSEITWNLTDDNTATGNALFTEIWAITITVNSDAATAADAVSHFKKTLPANLKTVTYGFRKSNYTLLNLSLVTSGLTIDPTKAAGSGISVSIQVTGI